MGHTLSIRGKFLNNDIRQYLYTYYHKFFQRSQEDIYNERHHQFHDNDLHSYKDCCGKAFVLKNIKIIIDYFIDKLIIMILLRTKNIRLGKILLCIV